MHIIDYYRAPYLISTNKTRLDVDFIHCWLSEVSYWAQGRPREVVETSIANSICFGVYEGAHQVGFARLVTDYATFAWLADVFVVEAHRRHGLGKWLVECVVAYNDTYLASLKRIVLATSDAHDLYRTYGGFALLNNPERWMERCNAKFHS